MTFIPLDQLHRLRGEVSCDPLDPLVPLVPVTASGRPRLPPWFKVQATTGPDYLDIKHTMDRLKLHTICEEARCPNRWECWNARTATFLILGDICT